MWTYEGEGPYFAICPSCEGGDAWLFLSPELLALSHLDNAIVTLYGFYGGDPNERLDGYRRVDIDE